MSITEIDFDKEFLQDNFDVLVAKSYKNNKLLWLSVKRDYLDTTRANKVRYYNLKKEYDQLKALREDGITVYAPRDPLGKIMKDMAEIIVEQKRRHHLLLHYIRQNLIQN